jgi:hypothetical protein
MPKLSLQTNVPVAAVLLAHGETAPSSYGPDQVKYRTDQGDLYVSEVVGALLNQMIAKENIQIGESVVFSKREQVLGPGRKGIRWSIERAAVPAITPAITPGNGTLAVPLDVPDELEAHLRASIAQVEARKSAAPAVSEFALRLSREANAIIDALAMSLKHANDNYGAAVKADDVRSILLSVYIGAQKNGGQRAA